MDGVLLAPNSNIATTTVQIQLLGSPQLHAHGQAIPLPRRQMRALFTALPLLRSQSPANSCVFAVA